MTLVQRSTGHLSVFPLLPAAALAVVLLAIAPDATIAAGNPNARMAIHLLPLPSTNPCSRADAAPGCNAIVSTGDLYPPHTYYACVLVTNGDATAGVSGVQFGISYNGTVGAGVDIWSWTNCGSSNMPTPGWPASNTGNIVLWENTMTCQRSEPSGPGSGVVALAGYFYMGAYSGDNLRIIPSPRDNTARVVDCSAAETIVSDPLSLGYAAFSAGGAVQGYVPCSESGPLVCSISGPEGVDYPAPSTFTVTSNDPNASFLWDITGFGYIDANSSRTGSSIRAGGSAYCGTFTLTVTTTGFNGEVCTCSKTVVSNSTTIWAYWSLSPTMYSETTNRICVAINPERAPSSCLWEISGNATIVGGGGRCVYVRPGYVPPDSVGHFRLTATPTLGGCTTTITREFAIYPGSYCQVSGPDTLVIGELPAVFQYSSQGSPLDVLWSGSSNVSLVAAGLPGIFDREVVKPLAPGPFTVTAHVITMTPEGPDNIYNCTKTGVVIAASGCGLPTNHNAKILAHLVPAGTGSACGLAAPACASIKVQGGLSPSKYWAMVLVTDGNAMAGVAGAEFGVNYDGTSGSGVDLFSWTPCSNSTQMPTAGWPAPGTGNLIIWDPATECQRTEPGGAGTGVTAAAGYFYLAAYSPDVLAITTHPAAVAARVYDCARCPSDLRTGGPGPSALGSVEFSAAGNIGGYNPCGLSTAVIITTWSRIKTLYR